VTVSSKSDARDGTLRFITFSIGIELPTQSLSVSSKENTMLITVLVVLAIIVLALIIWRNFVGRSSV
jgi:NhaP-type Na+/H+ or K+/H+ antiporter